MKSIIVLVFVFLSADIYSKNIREIKAEKTEARNAKAICLMNDNLMRGKRLKECMDKEIEKNRNSELSAKLKAKTTP